LALSGNPTWYAGSSWTHYRDGVAEENVASGVHVYQADKTSNDAAGVGFGSWATDAPWPGAIYCGLTTNQVLSAATRVLVAQSLRKYYSAVL
jgi:hypothetical protein